MLIKNNSIVHLVKKKNEDDIVTQRAPRMIKNKRLEHQHFTSFLIINDYQVRCLFVLAILELKNSYKTMFHNKAVFWLLVALAKEIFLSFFFDKSALK